MLRINRFFAIFSVVICLSGIVFTQAEVDRIYLSSNWSESTIGYGGEQYWLNYNTATVDRLNHHVFAPGRIGGFLDFDPIGRTVSFSGSAPGESIGRIVVDHDAQVRYASVAFFNLRAVNVSSGTAVDYPAPAGFRLTGYAVIDETRDRVYLAAYPYQHPEPPGEIILSFNTVNKTWSTIPTEDDRCVKMDLNPSNGRIYCVAESPERSSNPGIVLSLDPANPGGVHRIAFPPNVAVSDIAVNPTTNKIYTVAMKTSEINPEGDWSFVVINGADHSFVHVPFEAGFPAYMGVAGDGESTNHVPAVVVNPLTNRVYTISVTYIRDTFPSLVTLDGSTNAVSVKRVAYQNPFIGLGNEFGMAIDPTRNRLYIPLHENSGFNYNAGVWVFSPSSLWVLDPGGTGPVSAENPIVQADSTVLDFGSANVTGIGTVSVVPISDPAAAGDIPGGFAVSDVLAFEITPDANLQFSGPVTTCFSVPTVNVEAEFNLLAVLHREETLPGVFNLVDRTSSRDFSTRNICASTTSFSPFYLARIGTRITPLFDQSRAYRSGSTIPVKVQLLNHGGTNISSASTLLSIRGLRLIGGNTTTGVNDSGNSNPDDNFRFNSSLNGYIFNLSTRNLVSGRYVLSFYAGVDHSFFHTVEFQVR